MRETTRKARRPWRRKPARISIGPQLGPRPRGRIVQRDASEGVVRAGLRMPWHGDLYHRMLTLDWWQFFALSAVIYLAANLFFACLYALEPGAIGNARPGSFSDLFFFSVETFATVGYGNLYPASLYTNWVMTAETLVGIMMVALTTGMMFARVSRPTAQVLFAATVVIDSYNGVPTLMVRMGNKRRSQIIEASVGLTLLRREITQEGRFLRRFHDLPLLRARTPVFTMSFSAMHVIDRTSPLFGMTAEDFRKEEIELLVTVTGLEETLGQTVHARASYLPEEIVFGARYADIFGVTDDGRHAIDYARFHDTEPLR